MSEILLFDLDNPMRCWIIALIIITMHFTQNIEPDIRSFAEQQENTKIPALPLQFQHLPVELLSKEFTKLNSNHPYRIHYLGPRPIHTLALHRRYAFEETQSEKSQIQQNSGYPAPLRRIVNCNYINEKLRDNHHYRSSFFYRAFEGMNPTLSSNQLIFNSAFQGGNLDCVIKISQYQYDLFLRIDSNTRGHTNWYFFSVKNKDTHGTFVVFNICNLNKGPGLYDQGLRPFVFSKKGNQLRGDQWSQKGQQVSLQACSLRYEILGSKGDGFFRLRFNYTFQFIDDQVFFAYCLPYTYTQLHQDLAKWQQSQFVKSSSIGRSLSGLSLTLLHVTEHQKKGGFCGENKKNIVVIARAHPAQTCGSYVLRGFINLILGDSPQAIQLRQKSNFFIVPMVNPDGVVLGNSRTSASGKDLNREYLNVRRDLYPQVYSTKMLIARLQKKHGVLLFLDFHGHSRKKNTFFYGPNYPISHREYYKCRVLPKMIEKINQSFRFYSCSFQISEAKRSTARAVAFTQLKVPYSFTIESSVGLFYNPQTMKTINFQRSDWQQIGKNICEGVMQFIIGLQQLQLSMKERRIQRQKTKQMRIKSTYQDKQKEKEKQRKRPLFFDLIDQVKIISSKLGFEDEAESEEHDSAEDLQPYQLSEFNQLVVSGRRRQRKLQPWSIEQKEESLKSLSHQEEQFQDNNIMQEQPKTFTVRSSKFFEPTQRWSKIFSGIRQIQNKNLVKQRIRGISMPNLIKEEKKIIQENKKKLTLTNRNYFPEDRCQILSLPKNTQTKRQKPTWRLNGQLIAEIANRKGLTNFSQKLKIGRSSSVVADFSSYQFLRGIDLDNRAMTIKTFRRT